MMLVKTLKMLYSPKNLDAYYEKTLKPSITQGQKADIFSAKNMVSYKLKTTEWDYLKIQNYLKIK